MSASYRNDPNEALIREIKQLRQELRALQQSTMWVPVLNADPPYPSPGNFWVFADGRLRCRLYDGTIKEWQAVVTPGSTTSGTLKPARPAAGTTHTKQWSAVWSQSYRGDGNQRTDNPERLWIGNVVGGVNAGNNAALIGFDYADMAATLASALITNVTINYSNGAATSGDGQIHVWWGTHQNTSAPSTWGGTVTYPVADRWYEASETAKTVLPTSVGEEFRDGVSRGLLIAGGDGVGTYGWGFGFGTTLPPVIEVTYIK